MDEVIDFVLIRLYDDDDNKIDFPILIAQVKETLGFDLEGEQGKTLIKILTSNDLCTQTYFIGQPVLELTANGKSIINKYKSYSNYMENEKKRERNILNKIQERIFETFRKQKARPNHIVMMRVFRFSVIPELSPPEQDKFADAVNELIEQGYIIYEKDSPECFRLTEKGYARIYNQDILVAEEETAAEIKELPTVVILTAIEEEYVAVSKHLTDLNVEKREGTIYEKGVFSYKGKNIANVVIRECGDRNVNASQETERAINNFKPDCMLFVGIAGSVKPEDFSHGDVIFPTKICYYEGGKAEKDEFKVRPDCVHPDYDLEEWAKHGRKNPEWKNFILNKSEKTEKAKAGIGVISSGEKILEHIKSELGKLIKSGYNDTAVIEMEGYGFTRAVMRQGIEKKIRYGVVRGISDVVELTDEEGETVNRRPDDAKQLAVETAAAFAYWLIYKLYDETPTVKVAEAKPAAKAKSSLEQLEEKKIRLSVKPRLAMNGGSSRGYEGELQLDLLNKGERASLKTFRVIEGDVILHNEHLPYELEKDASRKIFLRTKDRGNSNMASYKVEIEYEDALEFKYISTIEGTGAKCKLIDTKEL